MIKAIIFDFGQTLVDSAAGFKSAEKIAQEQIFSHLFSRSDDEQWQTFLEAYRHIRKEYHARSDFSRSSIWQTVYERFNRRADFAKFTQMETEYWDLVKRETRPFPETIGVLKRLAKKFQLGIITNTQGQKTTATHRIELFPDIEFFFQVIIIAGESGLPAKPASEPFLLCLKKMGLKPSEAIYVGDDFQKDVCGSHRVGLHPIWIKHDRVQRSWPEPDGQFKFQIITSLNQLPEIAEDWVDL